MIPTFLAIDVGNSSIKWGLFDQGVLLDHFRLDLVDVSSWEKSWSARCKDSVKSILICGVVPDVLKKHHRWLLDICDKVKVVTHLDLPMQIKVDNPSVTGIDRLVASFAALKLTVETDAVIVVDAGSAVTVDLASGRDGFLGGAIMPGLKLMARSLNEYTAQLPEISVTDQIRQIAGANTVDAISFGVGNAFVGGISMLIRKLEMQSGTKATLFFTGGDGLLLANYLNEGNGYFPNLVLTGLSLLVEESVDG
ncbi:MAG: type III pantothenate kinase [Planctomycetota bacterium]|nr:type III pantothenate kinase [Planctomycetota bacterium]